jgi:hypothetical protein
MQKRWGTDISTNELAESETGPILRATLLFGERCLCARSPDADEEGISSARGHAACHPKVQQLRELIFRNFPLQELKNYGACKRNLQP